MKYGSGRDLYLNQEGILKNKLGAKTEEELDLAETFFVLRKLTLLLQKQIEGKFDLAHLKAIHKFLFEDVYEWAGELRTISISKGSSMFALPLRIEPEANKLFAQLKAENYLQELALEPFIQRLAFYWDELNMLHPFREGNGRTQRAFLILLARQAGYQIHFGQLSPEENIEASIKSQHCDYSLLEQIIRQRIKQLYLCPNLSFANLVCKITKKFGTKCRILPITVMNKQPMKFGWFSTRRCLLKAQPANLSICSIQRIFPLYNRIVADRLPITV